MKLKVHRGRKNLFKLYDAYCIIIWTEIMKYVMFNWANSCIFFFFEISKEAAGPNGKFWQHVVACTKLIIKNVAVNNIGFVKTYDNL